MTMIVLNVTMLIGHAESLSPSQPVLLRVNTDAALSSPGLLGRGDTQQRRRRLRVVAMTRKSTYSQIMRTTPAVVLCDTQLGAVAISLPAASEMSENAGLEEQAVIQMIDWGPKIRSPWRNGTARRSNED